MSKWSEYLKLLPKGIKNWDKVLEGYINSVRLEHGTLPLDQQEEIIRRRLICDACPFLSTNAKDYHTDRTEEHCTLCGCPKDIRTASMRKNCGIEDYNEEHPDTPMALKWTAYHA